MLRPFWLVISSFIYLTAPLYAEEISIFDDEKKFSQIEYANNLRDFGAVLDGEVLTAPFTFANTGSSTLNIIDVISDCACSVVEFLPKKIEVGETKQFKFNFNTAGFIGNQVKNIILLTDSLENSRAKFTIKAKVTPELIINPSNLILVDAVAEDLEQTYKFNLKLAGSSNGKYQIKNKAIWNKLLIFE